MKIFLSGSETPDCDMIWAIKSRYNLLSYYYVRGKPDVAEKVKNNSQLVLIDSGAHSFQKGTKVNWVEYTNQYAEFIKNYDSDKVLGYFEMDIDNIIGYEKVLELRKILESVSDKIIPVWHKNRGITDFKQMCADYSGRVIAITGFKNEDIKDEQYLMFLKYAKQEGCKVHCLGMTRKKILDSVPFDFVDSSSWKQQAIFGRVGNRKVSKEFSKTQRRKVIFASYLEGMKMQEKYERKWKNYE